MPTARRGMPVAAWSTQSRPPRADGTECSASFFVNRGIDDMADTMVLPLLPLKNSVLFPFALMPLAAGRPQSLASLEAASKGEEKLIAVFTQRNPDIEDPKLEDLSHFGTKAVIRRMG